MVAVQGFLWWSKSSGKFEKSAWRTTQAERRYMISLLTENYRACSCRKTTDHYNLWRSFLVSPCSMHWNPSNWIHSSSTTFLWMGLLNVEVFLASCSLHQGVPESRNVLKCLSFRSLTEILKYQTFITGKARVITASFWLPYESRNTTTRMLSMWTKLSRCSAVSTEQIAKQPSSYNEEHLY